MNVLCGENVHEQVLKYIPDYVTETVAAAVNADAMPELWNEEELNAALEAKVLPEGTNYVTRERLMKWDYELAIKKITKKVIKEYEKKIEDLKAEGIDFSAVERRVLLMTVDRNWIDHIDAMDQLRKGISLRAYGQVDPVISYKKEGFDMFEEMIERVQRSIISVLLKVKIEARPAPQVLRPTQPAQAPATAPAAPAQPQAGAPRVFRRLMPSPLSSMSSFKQPSAPQQPSDDKKE
jgi:preprotein translocase subunit SecA